MTKEYKPLTEWNPKKGDVFKGTHGKLLAVVTDTNATTDLWGPRYWSEPFAYFTSDYTPVSYANHTTTETDMPKPFEIHTETKTDDRKPYAWMYKSGSTDFLVMNSGEGFVVISSKGVSQSVPADFRDPHHPDVTHRYYEGDKISFTLNDASEWFTS